MANLFSVDIGQVDTKGATFIRPGVGDTSTATALRTAAQLVRPVAAEIQGRRVESALQDVATDVAREEEERAAELQAIQTQQSPEVNSLSQRLQTLQAASAGLPSGSFEARAKAELRRFVNQTPGLRNELQGVYNAFVGGTDVAAIQQARQQKADTAADQLSQMDKFGVQNLGMIPGWTSDPTAIAKAEGRLAIQQDTFRLEQASRLRELAGSEATDLLVLKASSGLVEMSSNFVVNLNGQDINVVDSASLQTLSSADRNALREVVQTQGTQIVAQLRASLAATGGSEADRARGNSMITAYENFFTNLAEGTDNTETLKQAQNDVALMETLAKKQALSNPTGQKLFMLSSIGGQGTVIANTLANEFSRSVVTDDLKSHLTPQGWSNTVININGLNTEIKDKELTETQVESVSDVNKSLSKALRDTVGKMSIKEANAIVLALGNDGLDGVIEANPEFARVAGEDLQAALPEVIQKVTTSLVDDYASMLRNSGVFIQQNENGEFFIKDISDEFPQFRVSRGNEGPRRSLASKQVALLNNYSKALAKLTGVSQKEASALMLDFMDRNRIQRMYTNAFGEIARAAEITALGGATGSLTRAEQATGGVLPGGTAAAQRAAIGEARGRGPDVQRGLKAQDTVNKLVEGLFLVSDEVVNQAGTVEGQVSSDLTSKIIQAESAGVATAKNPRSTATGPAQFIESTWLQLIRSERPDVVDGLSRDEILKLREDPNLSAQMTDAYAERNANTLSNLGHEVSDANLYLAHFLGPGGANEILSADLDEKASDLLGNKVIEANPFLKDMSAKDVIDFAARKVGG